MPRKPRPEFANGLYHVINRGVEQGLIVQDDEDRQHWLRLLGRTIRRYHWRVFAYVLLDDHFHLYFRIPGKSLSAGMHDFESAYATRFNKRHQRAGRLFRGRFKSVLVENDSYSRDATRYVHLNPLRAGIVENPAAYPWCSYRYYLNPHGAPGWLDWQTVMAEIGRTESAARVAYRRFVESGIKQPPANPFQAAVDGWILGSNEFVQRVKQTVEDPADGDEPVVGVSVDDVISAVCRAFDVERDQILRPGGRLNRPRDAAVLLARELTAQPVATLGAAFGVGATAITETVRRAERRLTSEPSFRGQIEWVKRRVR